jgi:hypothetical protein
VLASPVWQRQGHVVVEAYEAAGLLTPTERGRYVYSDDASLLDAEHPRALAAARFWAFGAVCHGADAGFPDRYRDKAPRSVASARRQAVRGELFLLSNGRSGR